MANIDYGRRPDPWSAQDRLFLLTSLAPMHAKILPPFGRS